MQTVVLWLGLWVVLIMGMALLLAAFYGIEQAQSRERQQYQDSRFQYVEPRDKQ